MSTDLSANLPTAQDMPSRKKIWIEIGRLSWPCLVELSLASLIGVVTMALVASLGKEAVSAIGITNQPIMIPNVIMQAFCVGGTALVARSLGADKRMDAQQAAEQTMFLSLIFSLLTTVIMVVFGDLFIKWMGAGDDYYEMACLYMRYCAIGSFFQNVSTAVAALLRGAGRTRLSMYASVLANVLNLVVGYVLIHGIFGIPSLGITGAAIAQLAAKILGCALSLWLILRPSELPIRPRIRNIFIPNMEPIRRICRIGTSTALEQLALRVGLIMFTVYIVNLGTAEYAAHNIASSIHSYVVNFGQAVSIALVSMVGQALGAQRPDVAERYFSEGIKICIALSILVMIPLLVIPVPIARLFTQEADVIENVAMALRILAFFTTAQILQIAICGGLRGGGDTTWPLISTMTGVLGMRMVLGYFLIVLFKFGLAGAWICWLADQTLRAIIIYFRFKSGKWKQVKV